MVVLVQCVTESNSIFVSKFSSVYDIQSMTKSRVNLLTLYTMCDHSWVYLFFFSFFFLPPKYYYINVYIKINAYQFSHEKIY